MSVVARRCPRLPVLVAARTVHSTAAVKFPRRRNTSDSKSDTYNIHEMPTYEYDDATVAGHIAMWQKRDILQYMRLIERDSPNLQLYRKQFVPPSKQLPLIVRSISYSGEEHPAARKQVVVAAVSQLPLSSQHAIHKFKLLAGARWSQRPPRDSGVGQSEHERIGEHGYIKISCEDFPEPAMNLKWGSDVVESLIAEANNKNDSFAGVPHDQRHLAARARKHRKGDHLRSRPGPRPTIKDFPKEWLPEQPEVPSRSVPIQ